MMVTILEWVGTVLIAMGAGLFLVAGVGVLRFPDLYSRFAAITVAAAFGVTLLIVGALLHEPSLGNVVRAALAIAIQLITSTVGTSALVRAALLNSEPMTDRTVYNDLEGAEATKD